MLIVYFFLSFLLNILCTLCQRGYGKSAKTVTDLFVYTTFTGVVATFVFYILSGFKLEINPTTLIYSGAYAVICTLSNILGILVYKYIGVAEKSVFSGTFSQVFTFLSGIIILSEDFEVLTAISALLMILATVVMFFENKNSDSDAHSENHNRIVGIILCILIAVIGTLSTLFTKEISQNEKITNTNSLFCLTNVYLTFFSITALLIIKKGNLRNFAQGFAQTGKRGYLYIVVNTIGTNLSTVVGVLILALCDVSFYSPISSAIGFIGAQLLDIIIVKKVSSPLALLFACASIAIGFFIN